MLIACEGIDGSGKTSLAEGLAKALASRGVRVTCVSRRLTESSPAASALTNIRSILKSHTASSIDDRALVSLYAASLAERSSVYVRPALLAGVVVVADRLIDTLWCTYKHLFDAEVLRAYLGTCLGVGVDHTLVCDLALQTAIQRLSGRGSLEPVESRRLASLESVAQSLRSLAESPRYTLLDTESLSESAMVAEAFAALERQNLLRASTAPRRSRGKNN